MKRREFLTSAIAVAGSGVVLSETAGSAQTDSKAAGRAWFELRLFHLQRGPKADSFDRFLRDALVPAINRAGIEHVGVFNVAIGPDSPTAYVLIQHSTLDSLGSLWPRLAADEE